MKATVPVSGDPIIPTEYGPEPDWHGVVARIGIPVIHRTFITRQEAETWVHVEMRHQGVHAKGTIAYATACPYCNRN